MTRFEETCHMSISFRIIISVVCIGAVCWFCFVPHCLAQEQGAEGQEMRLPVPFDEYAKNFVYVEALGSGGLYSLNWDRLISPSWAMRLGVSTFGFTLSNLNAGVALFTSLSLVTVPITSVYLINFPDNSPHHIELGGGITVIFGSFTTDVSSMGYNFTSANGAAGQLLAAYRFQPVSGGFSFRIGLTPFYVFSPVFTGILPWAGVSFGGTFGGF